MQNTRDKRPRSTAQRGASASRSQGAARTSKRRANPAARRRFVLSLVCLCSLLLFAALLFVKGRYVNVPDTEETLSAAIDDGTFFEGIRVNGEDIGGLGYEEAREKLLPSVTADMQSINIQILYDSTHWLLNAADMGVRSNLDAVLGEALLLGRSDTRADNEAMLQELASSGRDFTVGFTANDATLAARVAEIASHVGTQPVEPYVEADSWAGAPSFNYHEGVDGHSLDQAALCDDIKSRLAAGDYKAKISPALVDIKPQHDVEWLKANTQLRAQFQTSFGGSRSAREPNRVGNIQKATTMLNGACIAPGEEFNFNAFIGPRREEDGWPLAPGIVNGNAYEMQAGGGICQVSTTLYNALLCAGPEVEITERHHHSWPSAYADYGLDSTVTGSAESGKSLNFINNTGAPLYIFAVCDQEERTMTIYLYGAPLETGVSYATRGVVIETIEPGETKIIDNPSWPIGYEEETITGRKGYKAEAYRDTYVNGELSESELLYTDSYRSVTPEVTRGTGDPSLPKPESSDA